MKIPDPQYPVRVTLTNEGVLNSSNLPKSIRSRLDRFAHDRLAEGEAIQLKGKIGNRDRIRWRFQKNVDPEYAQKLRNFMTNEVYD